MSHRSWGEGSGPRRLDMADRLEIVVEETFRIAGRGTVVAGSLRSGDLRVGDWVEVVREDGSSLVAKVRSIEIHKPPDRPDWIGLVLDDEAADSYVVAGSVIRLA